MRGKIIQYNCNEGSGLVSADGRQFDFNIRQWRGEVAPTVNRVVELELAGEAVVSVTAVAEEVLLREKASELKEKLGGAGNLLGAGGGEIGRNILAQLGIPLAAAYAVFILASLIVGFGTFKSLGLGSASPSLYGTVDLLARNNQGNYGLFVYLAYLSFLVPVFWKHRFAAFATLVPALLVLALTGHIYGLYSDANAIFENELRGFQRMYGGLAPKMNSPYPSFSAYFSFGLGFYVCFASGLAAAWFGAGKTIRALVQR